ncbi:MAG TPA: DNA gyrase C-terminal beta-propeller domain-containing protein, partial [Parapedobacter sp.]|nr:DNA gyrase C-terminal beta-propeller domain-containing protein [Parapedobacter sp.]
ATGVRGISLAGPDDEVVGMISVNNYDTTVLVVSEKGYGKRTDIEDYRVTNRGGKGVKTINVTDKTGRLVAIKDVTDNDDLMIINKSGIVIRIAASELRVMGRATQGVRLISLKGDDEIASITKVEHEEEDEFIEEGENQENSESTSENDHATTDEASPSDDE